MLSIDLKISTGGATNQLKRAQAGIEKAVIDASNAVAKDTQKQAIAEISKAEKIPRTALRRRIRLYRADRDKPALVWIGSSDISAGRLRPLRQTREGVSAGRHRIKGAFLHTPGKQTKKKIVLIRAGRSRLPVGKVFVAMTEVEAIADNLESTAAADLDVALGREIEKRL